jgi:hypothetical protein
VVKALVSVVLGSALVCGLLWSGILGIAATDESADTAAAPFTTARKRAKRPAQARTAAPLATVRAEAQAPMQWPPERAFTARCRAPGGGCAPECAALASDRCLDPCFIHTVDCSKDCLLPDGSCGWPPSDE